MAKKYHYYVLVITNSGPVFVTKVDYPNRVSIWNENEKPLEMSSSTADDISLGLNLNGYVAYTVKSFVELETQPYRYSEFELSFVEKKKEE